MPEQGEAFSNPKRYRRNALFMSKWWRQQWQMTTIVRKRQT